MRDTFFTATLAALTPSLTSCQIPCSMDRRCILHSFDCLSGVGHDPSGMLAFVMITVSCIPCFVLHGLILFQAELAFSFKSSVTFCQVHTTTTSSVNACGYSFVAHCRSYYILDMNIHCIFINKFSLYPFSYSPTMRAVKLNVIRGLDEPLFGHLLTLRSTCLMTYPLESSLELTWVREIHFVRQQPTEPSEFHFATWVHFRHFVTCQSDLSDLSECVVFLMDFEVNPTQVALW